jgi:release factor glutamine methyltransferase
VFSSSIEDNQMTVLDVLNSTTHVLKEWGIENPRLNAELLLARSMNINREALYVRLHEELGEKAQKEVDHLLRRRISGEPLQYILGQQEFWSTRFKVDPRVLIPRPETELLVEQALSMLLEISTERRPVVLDIGTGSGAVAISLARERKNIRVIASDVSREALILARENAQSSGTREQIDFINGDLFYPFAEREAFDLILSNPPYIKHSEMAQLSREIRDFEPTVALDGGEDGLDYYRKIVYQAPSYLRKGGWLLLELGQGQYRKVSEMMKETGLFEGTESVRDLSGIERVVKARKAESRKQKVECYKKEKSAFRVF